jgi:hypothetical protein
MEPKMKHLPTLVSLSLLMVSGCGYTDVAPVTGIVTLDGQPLVGASVEFMPEVGRPSYGGTNEQGFYRLNYTMEQDGAVIGPCTVRVTTAVEDKEGRMKKELVPKKYNTTDKIRVSVEAKANKIDVKLESK